MTAKAIDFKCIEIATLPFIHSRRCACVWLVGWLNGVVVPHTVQAVLCTTAVNCCIHIRIHIREPIFKARHLSSRKKRVRSGNGGNGTVSSRAFRKHRLLFIQLLWGFGNLLAHGDARWYITSCTGLPGTGQFNTSFNRSSSKNYWDNHTVHGEDPMVNFQWTLFRIETETTLSTLYRTGGGRRVVHGIWYHNGRCCTGMWALRCCKPGTSSKGVEDSVGLSSLALFCLLSLLSFYLHI